MHRVRDRVTHTFQWGWESWPVTAAKLEVSSRGEEIDLQGSPYGKDTGQCKINAAPVREAG